MAESAAPAPHAPNHNPQSRMERTTPASRPRISAPKAPEVGPIRLETRGGSVALCVALWGIVGAPATMVYGGHSHREPAGKAPHFHHHENGVFNGCRAHSPGPIFCDRKRCAPKRRAPGKNASW